MSVTYHLGRIDIFRLVLYAVLWAGIFKYFLLGILVAYFLYHYNFPDPEMLQEFSPFVIALSNVIVIAVFQAVILLGWAALQAGLAPNKGVLGEHTIQLSEEGLLEQTAFNKTIQPWQAVSKTNLDGRYLWIHTSAGIHTIPLGAFNPPSDAQAFKEFIDTHIRKT